jgi:hypothetical protein
MNIAESNFLANEVNISLDVLRAMMMYLIAYRIDCTNVVALDSHLKKQSRRECHVKVVKAATLGNCMDNNSLLGLYTRMRDSNVTFGRH